MSRKSVAVLDVRSDAVTVLIGERGVNNTFVFQGIHTLPYDGYADAEFFDTQQLCKAVTACLEEAERSYGERIREIFVGVPGEFLRVVTKRCFMSFQSKRRVNVYDLNSLFDQGTQQEQGFELIRRSAVCYITSDNRRTIDPIGMVSDSLEGYLSYFYADLRYEELFINTLTAYGIRKVEFLPVSLAEALYLIPSEVRDEYAVLLDIGKLSMTFSVVCGNGIVYQNACSLGGGHVTAQLYTDGDPAQLPFDVAEAMIGKINLSAKDTPGAVIEYVDKMQSYSLPIQFLKEKVREGLDLLCERISSFLENYGDKSIDYKPILLTGGGITGIRGAREHLSNRLNKVVEIIAPKLPYYNKAAQSSLLSLLNMALETKRSKGFFYKLFNGIGG